LLYDGPWTAERYAAVEALIESQPDALHPVTHRIIAGARSYSAVAAFKAQYLLMELKRRSQSAWDEIDVLMTPTAGTIFKVEEIRGDPINLNSCLGYYTNFVNLLDLAAVAVPAGFRADDLPFGITLIGPRATDRALLALGARLHRAAVDRLGAMPWTLPPASPVPPVAPAPVSSSPDVMALAVCGAHMDGLPLNRELRDRGGRLLRKARTAACYRLFALPGGRRPGLLRVSEGGAPIEVEVWSIRAADFGSFMRGIPAPLGIGTVELEDGEHVPGFLCEAHAIEHAEDITRCGSWRDYLGGPVATRASSG
jgi:allophanate hydrolase